MLIKNDNITYVTSCWYEIGISKSTMRVYGVFETFESAINKILELEAEQKRNGYHEKFFVIEIQTMKVTDENGDIIFNNRIERKV